MENSKEEVLRASVTMTKEEFISYKEAALEAWIKGRDDVEVAKIEEKIAIIKNNSIPSNTKRKVINVLEYIKRRNVPLIVRHDGAYRVCYVLVRTYTNTLFAIPI